MDQAAKRSREWFESGYNCAESVLLAVAERTGVDSDIVPGVATGFCSGLSRTGGLCGAVGGAVLAIGMMLGRRTRDDSVDACYGAVQRFLEGFVAQFGSDNCAVLTGCHLGTNEGRTRFSQEGLFERCLVLVEEATAGAIEVIESADLRENDCPAPKQSG